MTKPCMLRSVVDVTAESQLLDASQALELGCIYDSFLVLVNLDKAMNGVPEFARAFRVLKE